MNYLPELTMPEPKEEEEKVEKEEETEGASGKEEKVFEKKKKMSQESVFKKPIVLPILSDSDSSSEEEEVPILLSNKKVESESDEELDNKKAYNIAYTQEYAEEEKVIRPKKRVQTERQKEALRRGRERSLATRRAKRDIKNSVNVRTRNKEKEIVEKNVKKDELEDLMLNTILAYDTKKKETKKKRKAEKAKEAVEQRAKDQLSNTLKKAMNPNDGADYWDACFNITY